jgi:hypothetical protein
MTDESRFSLILYFFLCSFIALLFPRIWLNHSLEPAVIKIEDLIEGPDHSFDGESTFKPFDRSIKFI